MTHKSTKLNGFFAVLFFMLISLKSYSQRDTILVDFGNTASSAPWNNISGTSNGSSISSLTNSKGITSAINLTINDAFGGINSDGTLSPATALGFPVSSTRDSFYGNTASFNGKVETTGGMIVSGLQTDKKYTFEFFASRTATDNRETYFSLSGQTKDTVYLNPSSNTNKTVLDSLYPASDGTIQITVGVGPKNNNTTGFFYIGALKLIYDHEVSIGPASLTIQSPVGGEFWQVAKKPFIMWESHNIDEVAIDYSTDNGSSWMAIDTVAGYTKQYAWKIPDVPSANCLIRLKGKNLTALSNNVFEIANTNKIHTIVILGSSTSAGTGASCADSSWVGRFRKTLFQKDTRFSVVNLAIGGYTTYHILPTGTSIPTGVNISIDKTHNVTWGLTSKPFAMIVNMPSNDAANNFPVQNQMNNLRMVYNKALSKGVKMWITTTQPRNFGVASQITLQKNMRDSTLACFGSRAIDFWSGTADDKGYIQSKYDNGDGIHLNDSGHRYIFEKAMEKYTDIFAALKEYLSVEQIEKQINQPCVYPNPASDVINIDYIRTGNNLPNFYLYNALGTMVRSEQITNNQVQIQIQDLHPGLYFYKIVENNRTIVSDKLIIKD